MIQMTESKPGEGMTLRTVSFQGTQITSCSIKDDRIHFEVDPRQARRIANPAPAAVAPAKVAG